MINNNSFKIKPFFGAKSKNKLLNDNGYITMLLYDNRITTRTFYEFNGPADDDGPVADQIVNEKATFLKSAIYAIGCAYNDKYDCFYITLQGPGLDSFTNVETAEEANEIYNWLIEWWDV